MKNLIYTFAFTVVSSVVLAQQVPIFNQAYYSPFSYNPALTGSEGLTKLFVFHKAQWTGLQGAPQTSAINLEGSVMDDKAGLGLSVFNDRTNIINQAGGYGSYSYRIKINNDQSVLLGAAAGMISTRINFDNVIVKDQNDMSLANREQSKSTFDVNIGAAYNYKSLQIGFSVPHLLNPRLNLTKPNERNAKYGLDRHFIGTAKYTFEFAENNAVKLTPLGMVRIIPGAPVNYSMDLIATYKDKIGLSVSYRSNYAIGVGAMLKLHESFTLGYSYDFILNDLATFVRTSHEVVLGYTFGSKVKQRLEKLETDLGRTDSVVAVHEQEIQALKTKVDSESARTSRLEDSLAKVSKEVNELKEKNKLAESFTDNVQNASDFEDENGITLKPGGYVIAGVFTEKKYAENFRAKLNSSVLIKNRNVKMYYIYTAYNESFSDAKLMEELLKARNTIDNKSWLLKVK